MSVKDFLMRKMLANKMKDMPQAEQDKILGLLEKNPELFQKITLEVQEKMKTGKDQMSATMDVVNKYQTELKDLL